MNETCKNSKQTTKKNQKLIHSNKEKEVKNEKRASEWVRERESNQINVIAEPIEISERKSRGGVCSEFNLISLALNHNSCLLCYKYIFILCVC